MKRVLLLGIVLLSMGSCATIVGGSKYTAHVEVKGADNAEIKYHGSKKGKDMATFKVKRKEADEVVITVTPEGCESQDFAFTERKFRGWAFTGSLVGWTGWATIPIPWGIILDGATGSWWKPDESESGINKKNFNNYEYVLDYTGKCVKPSN